jgi:hypothetical protein
VSFLLFTSFFFDTNTCFFVYIRCLSTIYTTGSVLEGNDEGKGPNDAGCVVWALGEFFFSFSSCF